MRDAFFKIGELNIAQNDLIPLLITYPHETDLAYNACKCWGIICSHDHASHTRSKVHLLLCSYMYSGACHS